MGKVTILIIRKKWLCDQTLSLVNQNVVTLDIGFSV